MPEFQIALVLTVDCDTYEEALHDAQAVAEGVGNEGENIYAVTDYEHDLEGQRVLYLPPLPQSPLMIRVDWDVSDEEATVAEERAARASLPKIVTVPGEKIEEWINEGELELDDAHIASVALYERVSDWLSAEYDYCVNGWARVA